jgi:hypothetical protein
MNVDEMQKLLDEFDFLPKIVKQQTYLELCKYPKRRFEEICSRLLEFYLAPNKEHGFRRLFLDSLFEMLEIKGIEYKENDIKTDIEVPTPGGKRLDILVEGKSFAIGIENKIEAGVYNPFGEYAKLLEKKEKEGKTTTVLMVLSLQRLTEDEKEKIKEKIKEKVKKCKFECYTYEKYFGIIKRNIGNYMNQGNLKYLAFIMDFIQTLENKRGGNVMYDEMKAFFKANAKKLDELQTDYQEYKDERWQEIENQLWELKDEIAGLNEHAGKPSDEESWRIPYDENVLIYSGHSGIQVRVDIEEDAAICHIFIVVPNNNEEAQKAWDINNEKTMREYQNSKVEPTDYGIRLTVARVPFRENKDFGPAVAKLYEVYQFVKTLTV